MHVRIYIIEMLLSILKSIRQIKSVNQQGRKEGRKKDENKAKSRRIHEHAHTRARPGPARLGSALDQSMSCVSMSCTYMLFPPPPLFFLMHFGFDLSLSLHPHSSKHFTTRTALCNLHAINAVSMP